MKKIAVFTLLPFLLMSFTGCSTTSPSSKKDGYHTIDAKTAKEMMDTQDVVIVDVRTKEEYQEAHIPHAQLLPLDTIEEQAPQRLKDKTTTLLVYCRSGNRSAQAARILAEMGYEQVYDFGGIQDWPYEVSRL